MKYKKDLKVPRVKKMISNKGENKLEVKPKQKARKQMHLNLRYVSYIGAFLIMIVSGCLGLFELNSDYIKSYFYHHHCTCNKMKSFVGYLLASFTSLTGLFIGAILFNYF